MHRLFAILTIVAAIFGALVFLFSDKERLVVLPVTELELAETPDEHSRGLMGRTELCPDCGMLFIFDGEASRHFWMRNTPTSLDMIFFDAQGVIVAIHKATVPNSDTTYSSPPAQYVLEMPAGYSERHGLKAGQAADMQSLISSAKS